MPAATFVSLLPFAAVTFSLLLALGSILRNPRSTAAWWFCAGMVALGLDSLFTGLSLRALDSHQVVAWLTDSYTAKSFLPVTWIGFSLAYSRGDARQALARWRIPLWIAGLLPVAAAVLFHDDMVQFVVVEDAAFFQFGATAWFLNVALLACLVLVVMNIEQTFRAAVGTMRWRIKFVVLGVAVIFGAQLYVRSQAILFSRHDVTLASIEAVALLIGCVLFALAYARTGWPEIDIYPSREVLRSSITLLIVGGYLFIVGILAQLARRFGEAEGFRFQSFVVLAGMAGLALLLLSDRFRQAIQQFVARHFRKAQHDSARIWTLFSQRFASVPQPAGLCDVAARSISETFNVLSVRVWLLDEQSEQLVLCASTARHGVRSSDRAPTASSAVAAALPGWSAPFNLQKVSDAWAGEWRELNPSEFPNGGDPWCVPLRAGEKPLGAIVLADRVNGVPYTVEERELLECIGDQLASVLANLRLADEVARAKEMEAFRTMSAFFVHDLKNAAASLNLMLKNLPVHFDDPAFREDALRAVGNTAKRIDGLIARLSAVRGRTDSTPVETDLNAIVTRCLQAMNGVPGVEIATDLAPVPAILADPEQVGSVVTNLLLNARDAVGAGGRVDVRTYVRSGRVVLSVADNGCGMTPEFVKDSLFRPFQSTKKSGLGIGMFQSRMIVERHGGSIQVESEEGKGTTVRVSFPVARGL